MLESHLVAADLSFNLSGLFFKVWLSSLRFLDVCAWNKFMKKGLNIGIAIALSLICGSLEHALYLHV